MQAVLYPNTRDLWETFISVLNRPYWQMYGELFYEDIFGKFDRVTLLRLKVYLLNSVCRFIRHFKKTLYV